MPTKIIHGVTLWAVPRFHRSEILSENVETGMEWVNRLKTYSFPLGQEDEAQLQSTSSLPDQTKICH
jgi:hypothetical protein